MRCRIVYLLIRLSSTSTQTYRPAIYIYAVCHCMPYTLFHTLYFFYINYLSDKCCVSQHHLTWLIVWRISQPKAVSLWDKRCVKNLTWLVLCLWDLAQGLLLSRQPARWIATILTKCQITLLNSSPRLHPLFIVFHFFLFTLNNSRGLRGLSGRLLKVP